MDRLDTATTVTGMIWCMDADVDADMAPVAGDVEIAVPAEALWEVFAQPRGWPTWNRCFTWVANRRLELGRQLVWAFEPIRPAYLYRLPAVAKIVELDAGRKVSWEVTVVPRMYALHTYTITPLSDGRSRFGSWEQASGAGFRTFRRFWLAHFRFVLDESLQGARRLERLYARHGSLTPLLERLP